MITDKYVFFWGGTCSQWAPSKFEIDNITYNCAEQYMMAKKALLFKDKEAHEKIMESKSPKEQKTIGRKVKGFDTKTWEKVCREYVYEANLAKFTQNKEMLKELKSYGDREIVEASPVDKIWGIGLHPSDAKVHDKKNWRGKNWLGEAIMRVKNELNKK